MPTSSAPVHGATSTPARATAPVEPGRPAGAGSGRPPRRPSSSARPGRSGAEPGAEPDPTVIRLVEPRSGYRGVPVFQKDIALVLLAFCAAMAALVGSSVVAARRR